MRFKPNINIGLLYGFCCCNLYSLVEPSNYSDLSEADDVLQMLKGDGQTWTDDGKIIPFQRVNFQGTIPLKKRHVLRTLGEKCSNAYRCAGSSVCIQGVCSCPYDYYEYKPPAEHGERSECRRKIKYGYSCSLTEDCKANDANSACIDSLCRCINGTHYIGSRTLLTYDRRCHKILERKGDKCEIDEQCSRLADNHHKCRCIGVCDCTSADHYGGCSICHENIKRTFFGGAAFIVILLTSRLFSKMRNRSSSPQERIAASTGARRNGQMLNSNTVPAVSSTGSNLRNNRRVALSLPDVFLIDRQNFGNLPSSQTTHFLPHGDAAAENNNGAVAGAAAAARNNNDDAPPSYDDIVESDRLVWNEPPPAYEEVALKYMQPRKP